MVTYIDAATAPLKNTGQIRLYGPEDFEGMQRAGQLTARCLDALVDFVVPGVTTNQIDASSSTSAPATTRSRQR